MSKLEIGMRVEPTKRYPPLSKTAKPRRIGTIMRQSRLTDCWVVGWDDFVLTEQLHKDFIRPAAKSDT